MNNLVSIAYCLFLIPSPHQKIIAQISNAELKINFGEGYRVYLGKDGQQLVILLVGGTKKKTTARY